ncbi:MAG: 2-succinyl-5-enolpyruvyl-6-hydroxy-3-cyclohexene-1-carboxylic-acid synthase [Moritella sp.]|uniref:2-succinyl-5-enolpyruvyl-6-hydroxy-3- cyclohexene-1-carboxylic-acid synthase n=1 Tax=Moritella sp. TaxID=78556 RepID=UPI0029B7E68C|nr:2-succinyl-5-enolpyruvyl-6-hydroxy-3-cyclohexene-1-carboxylic-acid synthase [Moritella sp.]MDX2319739.1 2-succinyl-5-enolpyruvyl-6-hydroxy-3-cyclohexene-1-carboxylic-acid synthase [Moritella sp.]
MIMEQGFQRSKHQAPLNRLWAELILEELTRLGVNHVCIAPGSRSTPLVLAAENNDNLILHSHFDERGLGFYALGLAKSLQAPVAVIVTSGTAVANLLPAVVESGLTKEKLVLLTADRPLEQINCGANQAIQQAGLFSSHVGQQLLLPSPDLGITPQWLLSSIDQSLALQQQAGGAVHINCPYPEPLYGGDADFSDYLAGISGWQAAQQPYLSIHSSAINALSFDNMLVNTVADNLSVNKMPVINRKGLVVVGAINTADMQAVKQWAETLGWPVLVDPQSGGSSAWSHYDVWLQNQACQDKLAEAEILVQFGARLVSKRLGQFIAEHDWQDYWLIAAQAGQLDPYHQRAKQFVSPIQHWLTQFENGLLNGQLNTQSKHPLATNDSIFAELGLVHRDVDGYEWARVLTVASATVRQLIEVNHIDQLTEISFAATLDACFSKTLLNKPASLFIGNSLIVRLLDMFAALPNVPVFSNRGASGIDGLLATAAGVQQGQQQALLCLLGDTSLLYDLNSLALFSKPTHPSVIVVLNNDGGAIFDMLPVAEQQKEQLYRMPHGFNFEHAAAMFDLDYVQPQSLADALSVIHHSLHPMTNVSRNIRTLLVEIVTPAGAAAKQLKQFFSEVKDAKFI